MPKILLLLCALLLTQTIHAQSQDDFNERLSKVYVTAATDQEEAKVVAKALFEQVESQEALQTYANYYSLYLIFTNQTPDESLATACKDRADEKMGQLVGGATSSSSTGTGAAGSDTDVIMTWTNDYFPALFKNDDPRHASRALAYVKAHPPLQSFNNYTYLAYAFERNGDFNTADQYYALARTLAGDEKSEFHPYSFHANFLSRSGKYLEAETLIKKIERLAAEAIALFRPSYYAESLTTRFVYYLNIGDYLNYIKSANKMYEYYETLSTGAACNFNQSSRYTTSAHAYEMLKNYERAMAHWKLRDDHYRSEVACYNEQYPNNRMLMLSMLPVYQIKRGQQAEVRDQLSALIQETEAYYDNFAEYGNLNTRHMKALHMAYLGAKSYPAQFDQVLTEIRQTKDFTESTLPFSNYAYFAMRDRDYSKSEQIYDELFQLNASWINDLIFTFGEKAFITYYNSKLKVGYDNFHSLVRLSSQENHSIHPQVAGQAYDNILLTKSIGFKSSQKRKKAFLQSNDASVVELYQRWIEKKQQLIQAYQQAQATQPDQANATLNKDSVELLQVEVQKMENELSVKASNFQQYLKVSQPRWQEVRNQLKNNEAAIEIIRFDWRDQVYYSDSSLYAAYVIQKNSAYPEVIYLPTLASDLEKKYYNQYRNSIRLKIEDNASYDQFWKPIKGQLSPDINKVYFSPDGIYHLINLPTLKNPATGKYLIDELEIQNVTTTYLDASSNAASLVSATLIGRPDYDTATPTAAVASTVTTRSFVDSFRGGSVTDLPGTEAEILAIRDQMKIRQMNANLFLAEQATEQVLYDLKNVGILHIATHGYWSRIDDAATDGFRTFNAMVNSGLLLAGVTSYYQQDQPGQGHDGILTAYEAQNLSLEGVDLVVLSACETGLGHFDAGEGVYGLQRAFRAAGAQSVMTSLWKVDDSATKEFMIAFYQQYLASQDKNEAFRKAQMAIKAKYPEPYYWGAFVMTGQ